MQAQYRRIGTQESLWAVHTVRTSTTSPTAIQWEQVNEFLSGPILKYADA